MASKPLRSLRPTLATWLFLAVLGATIAAVLTCTLIIDGFVRVQARGQATRFLQTNADALRDALDRGMAQHYEEVRVIAQLDQVAKSDDPPAVQRALDQVRASFPALTWLGLTDTKGAVVAAVGGLLQGVDVSARPWHSGGFKGTYVGDVHSALLLAKLLPKQAEPWRFVDIATPVFGPGGEKRGVLGAHLSWTWAAEIKRDLVDLALKDHHAEALILAADDTVLLGPPDLVGKKLDRVRTHRLLIAESRTAGAGRYPGLGWNVVLRQPEAVAMADFRVLQQRTQVAAGILCLALAPLLWLLARRLARPLWQLSRQLESSDGAAVRAPPHPLYREADVLGHALAQYARRQAEDADRLRELNTGLETRVEERTAALARSNAELGKSEQRFRDVADNVPVLISYVDKDERYQLCNGTHRTWLGMEPEEMVGRTVAESLPPAEYGPRRGFLTRAIAGHRTDFELEQTALGVTRYLQTTYLPDLGPDGKVQGVYALSSDVSAMRLAEKQMAELARTDALTGLPNRHAFNEKLAEALNRSRRSRRGLALFFLDVDKFKSINDSLGHAAGDDVLKIFARRLASSVRVTDTVARLAGDEFVVLEGLHNDQEPQLVADKIIGAINQPFAVEGRALNVSTSIGIAFQPDGHIQPDELLAAADKALYAAKAGGRNTFRMEAAEGTARASA